jgi:hypothetical protein
MRLLTGWQPLAAAAALAVVVAAVLLVTIRTPRQAEQMPPQTATGHAGEPSEPAPFTVLDNEGKQQSATVARMIWALEEESMGAGKVLVATLQAKPEALSSEELAAIDKGLRTLDRAISETAAALRADPENPTLVRKVTGYYQQRLSIMRRATEIALHA